MVEDKVMTEQEADEAISEGYQKAYEELTQKRGYSPRKARRYLDSVAKRNLKKFVKKNKTKLTDKIMTDDIPPEGVYLDNEGNPREVYDFKLNGLP